MITNPLWLNRGAATYSLKKNKKICLVSTIDFSFIISFVGTCGMVEDLPYNQSKAVIVRCTIHTSPCIHLPSQCLQGLLQTLCRYIGIFFFQSRQGKACEFRGIGPLRPCQFSSRIIVVVVVIATSKPTGAWFG